MGDVLNNPQGIFQSAQAVANTTAGVLSGALERAGVEISNVQQADAMDVIAAARASSIPAERAQMLASGRVPLWVACLENANLQRWLAGFEVTRTANEKSRSRVMKYVAGRGKARAPRKFRSTKQVASSFYKRPYRAFTARAGYRRQAKRTYRRVARRTFRRR